MFDFPGSDYVSYLKKKKIADVVCSKVRYFSYPTRVIQWSSSNLIPFKR